MVDGIADHEQGGESQMIVADNPGEILQFATVYLLFFPSELVAGGYGRLRRVGL